MSFTYWEIGPSIADLLNVHFDLDLDEPYQDGYVPYTVSKDTASGVVYGHGWEATAWRWGVITLEDRAVLKSYCPGRSAEVYIRTRDSNWDWVYCKAVMIWPEKENPPSNGSMIDLVIVFRIVQNYGTSPP